MLGDVDRNLAYRDAIAQVMAEFRAEQRRAPRVLDLGAGTGLLTAIALWEGAEHVTAVEANSTTLKLLKQQLKSNFPTEPSRYTIFPGLSFDLPSPSATNGDSQSQVPYDMVISELMGSMLRGESIAVYICDVVLRGVVQRFPDNKVYVVPQSASMTLAAYSRMLLLCNGAEDSRQS
jgi:predicted RNA methylase